MMPFWSFHTVFTKQTFRDKAIVKATILEKINPALIN